MDTLGGRRLILQKELPQFIGRSESATRTIVETDHEFPKPIRPGGTRGKAYYNVGDVTAWKAKQFDAGVALSYLSDLLGKYGVDITKAIQTSSGVYLLYSGGELLYVGQSVNVYARVPQHRDKSYDRVMFVPCAKEVLDVVESVLIVVLSPKLNGPPPRRDIQLTDITNLLGDA